MHWQTPLLPNGTSPLDMDDPLSAALSDNAGDNYIPPMRLSGPNALPEGSAITSLDFDQQKDASQVVIGLQNVSEYKDNKPTRHNHSRCAWCFCSKISLSCFGHV